MKTPEKRNGRKKGRRRFLKTVSLGAGATAWLGRAGGNLAAAVEQATVQSSTSPGQIEYPRIFRGRQLRMIAFPLGGIGTGSISLGGRGQLRDWEIFNRPDKGNSPQYAFPSLWTERPNQGPIARVLEARILPPYEGPTGLGFANAPGLPRVDSCTFTGEFPVARIDFEDSNLPVKVSLEAFSPFIPLNADDSGLPALVLRYQISNPTSSKLKASIGFSIENPIGESRNKGVDFTGSYGRTNEFRKGSEVQGLLMRNPFLPATEPLAGSFALSILGAGAGKVSYLRGWPSARWWESALLFWDDFSADGELGPESAVRTAVGSLCLLHEIPGGDKREYTFLLTWHFPNRTAARCGWSAPKGHEQDVIGNFYSTRFRDASEVAEYVASNLTKLEAGTRQFVSAIRETTLSGAVKDAAMSNLSTLRSPTCFRTSDGHFHGFEGCNDKEGCCFGSCTHVWNYEAATAHLFPTLSRSLREQQFGFSTDKDGRMDFRLLLPAEIEHWGYAAADGQMGVVMKLYLDWRLSGDTAWLRRLWPSAKRALEFAWIAGGWDANRDRVMEGVQHNTYDVEFVGPNPLCGIWYLGALRAGEEMARAVGDRDAAEQYRKVFSEGSKWIDAYLFNGEFYVQKVGAIRKEDIARGLQVGMGTGDTEHPTFQLGDGCLVDQLVGQYFAEIAGLGLLLNADHIRATLNSIYKYNYKRSLNDHESVQRIFALNDEAALVICDYPHGKRPQVPFPYFAEVMTGFEYSAAILMLYMDMIPQGIELIENIRRRYDGEKRNPWDEAECGYHYARAMASWASIPALSGFRYHGAEGSVVVEPRINPEKFAAFWSTATAWGTFSHAIKREGTSVTISVVHGELACRSVSVMSVRADVENSSARVGNSQLAHAVRRDGRKVIFAFTQQVTLKEGDKLFLEVSSRSSRE